MDAHEDDRHVHRVSLAGINVGLNLRLPRLQTAVGKLEGRARRDPPLFKTLNPSEHGAGGRHVVSRP